jgi:outer membrane protein assembly factor BamA
MRSLGFKIERDTTPNRFYPVKGSTFQFNADFFSKAIGGSFTFQTYRMKFNTYYTISPKQVFAYNLFVCSTAGQAPFFGQCIFGFQDELRGYPTGRYIDKKMIATQGEFRQVMFWRLGAVIFAGLGEVAPSFADFNGQNLLGSVGGGLRFNLSTKYHVNLRTDIAQGKNDHTFTMGIGEAF